jgi:hypothetical protein
MLETFVVFALAATAHKFRPAVVSSDPPPMPHGFSVHGGESCNVIAIDRSTYVIVRKLQ